VVCNRLDAWVAHKQLVANGLKQLSLRLGFRSIDGFAETTDREFFPRDQSGRMVPPGQHAD